MKSGYMVFNRHVIYFAEVITNLKKCNRIFEVVNCVRNSSR